MIRKVRVSFDDDGDGHRDETYHYDEDGGYYRAEDVEAIKEDAERYRFLRSKAIDETSLEAFVALGMADFIADATKFDAWIDKERAV